MFFFMFFLSTPQIRRTALFIMNVVAVVSGVFAGFFHVDSMTMAILHPSTPSGRGIQIFPPAISLILPIYIDCILAVRLYIIYPRSMTSSSLLALIFVPVVVLKFLRTINAAYFLLRFSLHLEHDRSMWEAFVTLLSETPCLQIEWIAASTIDTARKVSGQLRNLFYLGLSSFVFPTPGIDSLAAYNIVFSTNTNFQIIGVLLATIWVSKERSLLNSDSYYPSTSLPFHARTVDPARTWASENLPPSPPHRVEGQPMAHIDGVAIMHLDSHTSTPADCIPTKENIVYETHKPHPGGNHVIVF
ncbi:hypothetical protein DL96DRAFT_1820209 [Flagelloscypha sp. PMI_526]|nr:hypothetical protein DL96DRAFT_1820209 [Flagelloscypha sp. PMI_526]